MTYVKKLPDLANREIIALTGIQPLPKSEKIPGFTSEPGKNREPAGGANVPPAPESDAASSFNTINLFETEHRAICSFFNFCKTAASLASW
jgi:hypothetical protein